MKNVCIYGCAKNVEQYLPKVFNNINKLKAIFEVKGIFIGFDDSDDNTENKLLEYTSIYPELRICFPDIILKENEVIDSYGNKSVINFIKAQSSKERCINISNARNRCLKAIRDSKINPDYIISMDFDDVCSENINIAVLKYYMARDNIWDGLTFYNENYYDFWALSISPFTLSCLHCSFNMRLIKAMSHYLKKQIQRSNGLLKCQSAFNGFAIYKYEKYGSLSYSVIHHNIFHSYSDKIRVERQGNCKYFVDDITKGIYIDCEHRSFHCQATMIHGANLYMASMPLFPPYKGEHSNFLYN